jgi:hypothetical protein
MKLVTFRTGRENRVGVLQGEFVVDIAFLIESLGSMGIGVEPELKEAFKLERLFVSGSTINRIWASRPRKLRSGRYSS